MPYYRKINGSDTWHWCTNCPDWPTEEGSFIERFSSGRPKGGELDNKCKELEKKGNCKAYAEEMDELVEEYLNGC